MRKVELGHNTDEQVREYLAKGLAVVDALEPPDDLRQIVYAKAVDLYSSKSVTFDMGQVPVIARGGPVP